MNKTRPNILFIMADQLAPQFLPTYGHRVVKAPTLQRLADQGVVFDATYCNAPLCAPARYSLMTGRLPSQIGAWDNATELSAEIPTFAHYLSSLGYRTCLSGKMHFCGPDQLHGFHERLTTDVYPSDFTWTPDWDDSARVLDWFHTMDVVRNAGPCVRSSNLDYDDEVAFTSTRYLFDHARRDSGQPFCLVASFINPHDPYTIRPEYWSKYDPAEIDMPRVGERDAPFDPHSDRLRRAIGMNNPAPTPEQIRNARHAYYGAVSYIDDQVGALLRALEESGQAENTVVIFTSDHGDMLGERGLWYKMSWFEHSARVPLIVSFPSAFSPRRVAAATSHIDLLPTLIDLASGGGGFNYPTPLEGRSLLPELSGKQGRDEAIGEYFAEGTRTPLFMIRRGSRKFVTCDGDPDQLYALDADPHELHNLADAPAHDSELQAFRAEARARWDVARLRGQVLESQRRRRYLAEVMRGANVSWDHQPLVDASKAYIRNNLPIYEIERRSRFP
ncbi:choline-sulfatase [Melittangium boletus]|uniref:Choline-sulfatase n=1 Tax=Melittangium boletus DSM 14713 TaxID=1294270 RepID=A0A250INL5_9BACT|nr:choline-sulfatase [Melittangium boletus]ATB33335.1 choline-sulfatase [Melittangium boletus DSM 14713]